MDRPKRQSKAKWKYDEDEFVIPEEAAQMYWEANTRKVYRVLGFKDIKTSLKNTEVHILWPDDGKWYLAEVEQIRVKDMIAYLRYPETNEEEEASLQELIKDKCIAVIEHLPKDAKLKRGREIPVSEKDAEGAEYEDCESEPEQFQQQGSQQHNSTTPGSARKPKDEDSDFDAEEDSDAEVLSDDEKFDSDAHVSDDEVVSDQGEEGQGAAAAAAKHGSKKIKHSSKHKDGRKLNTPSRGTKQQRVSVGLIGPIAGPGPQQQQLLPMGSGAGGRTLAGGMMFVPTGATGVAAAGQNAASLGPFAGNSAQWGAAGQQGMLGKKRGSEGYPGNHAKRHAGASGGEDASGGDNATGSDAFKKAMLEKLLAKKSLAAGGGAAAGIAGAAAGGVGRSSSGFTVRKSIERRLSGSGSGGPLARALSDVDVRQKAAAQLAVGLKKAVEEAQAKHKQQQHQTQERDAAAAAGAAGEQQQQHGEQEAAAAVLQLPDPQKLATTIEQHLFELCGSVNNEYKSKLRSLAFNLRDPQNPDIREHVLKGEVAPANLVRMSAADLANKDLAEWRRKIEEEHNKAIELDVEAAAKFSTAAAWATREERLKQAELALMGILAQEKTRKATPEPERTPPYAEIAAAAAADQNQQQRQESEAGNVGLQEGREQQQQQSGSAGALAGEGEDWDAADAAGGGTPTHPADDGAATPTHPASEEGVDMELDQLGHGMNEGSNGNAAAMGDKQMELQQQRSEQLSNLSGAAGAAPTGAADSAATPTVSASLGLPAGSVAGGVPGALQQLGSVSSKTTGGLLAGINWAAIKNEAMKSVPKEQQQAAGRQQQDAAAGTGVDVGAGLTAAAGTAATADDAPYNPDDDEDDGQPYDPSEAANVGAASGATAAVTASQGAQPAAAAGAAAIAPAVDPDLPDFLPVISARPKEAAAAPTPGDTVWHGSFAVPGSGTFAATVKHVGGMGEVGHMLGPAGSGIDVIGRVALDKFADFTEELRKSRSRTISLGVVGVAPGAAAVDTAFVHDLLRSYSSKGRIGKLALSKEVEGYLVAKSEYAARLLKTAIKVAPSEHQHLLPREVASSEFLLLLVHRKDYVPPRHGAVGRPPQQAPQQMPPTQMQQQQPMPGAPGLGVPPPSMQQAVPNSDTRLDPRRRAAAAGQQQQQAGVVPPPPPHIATPGPVADASPGPGQAAAAAPTIAGPAAGLDLNSLSALAAALGLPGGAPAAAATGNDAAAAAVTPASSNGAGAGLPWTTLGGVAATGEQLQLQQVPGGLPGPPAPPAPGGPPSGSAQGPSSGGAPAGLFAALQQLQQALPPPPPGAPGPGPDGQQQQQQYNTLDLRPMQGPPGAEQMVFDLRQQQQQQHLPPPPDLATLPPAPAPPAPGAAGGAPVIILPPGAAIPAPGTVGIPDGAVFMTQDPATGALIPVGGNMPPGTPILGPPGAPLPPGVFPPGHGPPPGPFASHGAPPPRPYDPMFADQPPPGYVFEGPPPLEFGLPPPPHHFGGPPRPRVPGGGPPRPMVRSQRGPPGGGPPRY